MLRFLLNLWLGCLPICCLSQVENKAFTLVRMIERNHMQPKQVDDAFSEAVFKGIIEELDPYKIYFKANDIKTLESFEKLIDDDIKNKQSVFLTSLQTTYQSALKKCDDYALQLLEKPFDFTKADFFIEPSKAALPVDDAAWKKRFTQYLKWRILVRMQEQWEAETAFEEDSTAIALPVNDTGFFNKNEAIFRAGIAKNVKKRMTKRAEDLSTFKSYLEKVYLDQIAQTFDPHTNYFDDKAKDEFTESLSSQSLDFGFELEEDEDGDLIISGLVPGGAAWNTGNIYKDDKLMQIKMANGKLVQAKDLSAAQLQTLLNGEGKGQVELQLKGTDGKSKKVKLQKEEATNEENIVRGFVLEGDKKIGYIALPGFYTEWDDNQSSSCANDIAKEIVKLKREKIDGLIFDLRYNGGGSLQEAIEIAGIFIDAGPMAIIRDQTKKAITLKDPSRGQIYDGPLMVMINGQSASASELVAATLQDYQRATIVGSPSFGKATMQVVLPLDTMFNPEKPLQSKQVKKQTDYIKVTTGALYRITGGTNQFNGVIPDILLPDVFETMGYAEKTLPNALRPDTITKVVAFTPLPQKDLGLTKDFSTKELMKAGFFAATQNWVINQKKLADTGSIPLTWEAYLVWDKAQYPPDEEAEEYMENKSPFTPKNASFTQQMLSYESDYKQELNKEVLSLIASDLYIHAAYQIFLKSVL
jgi:carboxyl-terminal processing protease